MPFLFRAKRVPCRGTMSSSGPLNKTKSRINGLLLPSFPFCFPSLRAEGEGHWPGEYCLTEYGLYLLVACSFTELETGGLFEFVLLSPPVVLLVLLLVKIRLTSDSTVSA